MQGRTTGEFRIISGVKRQKLSIVLNLMFVLIRILGYQKIVMPLEKTLLRRHTLFLLVRMNL